MDLSTPLGRIGDAGAQAIRLISAETEIERERTAVGAGEDEPEGPSISELDDILDGDRNSIESLGRPEQENIRLKIVFNSSHSRTIDT
jgi:hypothetical protein